jgi:hypothetical protein
MTDTYFRNRAVIQELEMKMLQARMRFRQAKHNSFATGILLPELEEMYNDEVSGLSLEIEILRREILNDK